MSKPKIGLALGSGGARGWCHIGVIEALEDLGIKADVVVGCSMGAIVGGAYAAGRMQDLTNWATALTAAGVVRLLDIRPMSGGIIQGRGIYEMFDAISLPEDFADLETTFITVATDMVSGNEVWFNEGNVADAIRAAVSLPGIVGPSQVDGRWMLDGGLTNPVPVSVCYAERCDVVIAVNPNARPDGMIWVPPAPQAKENDGFLPEAISQWLPGGAKTPPEVKPSYTQVASAAIDIMVERIRRARLAAEPPHILLNTDLNHMSILEFHKAQQAIDEGRRIVEAQSERLKAICGV